MAISVFDLFKIGIGPSSSHTVGPMKAAAIFSNSLYENNLSTACYRITIEMYGSLAATGAGHGTPKAIILGLQGEAPETVDVDSIEQRVNEVRESGLLTLADDVTINFSYRDDLIMHRDEVLPFHPNGMRFTAFDKNNEALHYRIFFSVGGGFVIDESASGDQILVENPIAQPWPFTSAKELLAMCRKSGRSISSLMLENERVWRSEHEINHLLDTLWKTMNECIDKGCRSEGIMPGGLKVKRRAAHLYRKLKNRSGLSRDDALLTLDWVTLYALAVNEENAMGGRVVTAPTNGAAGIIPAALRYYMTFADGVEPDDVRRFLLTAGAIGILYKTNASISGAEVGCQGEVGSACSMAAGALAEVLGATPEQVENAAEIAMEHNLGLTCDPIGGLVQVPCIERNAMAAIKAISAARMALRGNGEHYVSLDQVIATMRETGRDMKDSYKETARGGLAVHVLEVPVSIVDC
ncbi:L-serine dehydratase [Pseudohongiella nitratireducens]|uniref:L-serine dehydratase n=1 Tax=Pseudohongiella nitratireducens TaxID=1768907 RepID=A0A916QJ92_9GAMM|nr:L-serine ammonia-lyase [Pseudohongiella nitratireducens]GFZ76707.1 L-serine dehydratase [Pseudohongiella nitratireducens]